MTVQTMLSYLANKIANLRVFPEHDRLLHFTTAEVGGGVLVVSQFTILGDCRKGRRPSFDQSAPPELAEKLYEELVSALARTGLTVATGRFRAMMEVSLINDGPVTLLLDSKKLFYDFKIFIFQKIPEITVPEIPFADVGSRFGVSGPLLPGPGMV